jgi:hypothetical protein
MGQDHVGDVVGLHAEATERFGDHALRRHHAGVPHDPHVPVADERHGAGGVLADVPLEQDLDLGVARSHPG